MRPRPPHRRVRLVWSCLCTARRLAAVAERLCCAECATPLIRYVDGRPEPATPIDTVPDPYPDRGAPRG